MSNQLASLQARARAEVQKNFRATASGILVAAGSHQFNTLWVRDFCFAVPGLIRAGFSREVESSLRLILTHVARDGQVPRGIDTMPPQLRVALNSLPGGKFLIPKNTALRPVRAEMQGEHGTPALDSQFLLILALDQAGLLEIAPEKILLILKFAGRYARDKLIYQPAFSDWCDSQRREGYGFYLNLLHLWCLRTLEQKGLVRGGHSANEVEEACYRHFFDQGQGLFRQTSGRFQLPLESHLLLLENRLFSRHADLSAVYRALKQSLPWRVAGLPLGPESSLSEKAWTVRLVGLKGYHDRYRWPWLIAAQIRVAAAYGDDSETSRLISLLHEIVEANGTVPEIVELESPQMVRRLLYCSEFPFTWACGQILQIGNDGVPK